MKRKTLISIGLCCGVLFLGACSEEEASHPVHENMELESKQETEKIDPDKPTEAYTVVDGDYETFLDEYSKQYTEDGWEIILDSKPDFMNFEKDGKQVKVMPVETEEGIKVFLYEEQAEDSN